MVEFKQKYEALLDDIDEPWWMIWTMVCDMLPEMCEEDEMDHVEVEARQYLEAEYNYAILKGLAKHFGF